MSPCPLPPESPTAGSKKGGKGAPAAGQKSIMGFFTKK